MGYQNNEEFESVRWFDGVLKNGDNIGGFYVIFEALKAYEDGSLRDDNIRRFFDSALECTDSDAFVGVLEDFGFNPELDPESKYNLYYDTLGKDYRINALLLGAGLTEDGKISQEGAALGLKESGVVVTDAEGCEIESTDVIYELNEELCRRLILALDGFEPVLLD